MAREFGVLGCVLGLLCALAFGPQLQPGGFYNDDWIYLETARYSGGFFDAAAAYDQVGYQPLMRLYWPAAYGILGTDPTPHVAWLLLTGVAVALLLYALLRRLDVGAWHAGLMAVLVLLFADSDSARFWPCISANSLSLALYLGSVLVSMEALQARGGRAFALHATGLALLMASVMLYVITLGLALFGGALYAARAGRRGVLRWAVDVGATLVVVLLFSRHTVYDPLPLSEYPRRIVKVFGEGGWVLADSFVAPADPPGLVAAAVCVVCAAVLAGAWLRARRMHADPAEGAQLRNWALLGGGAALAAVAAYAPIVPSDYLSPRGPGLLNRVNIAAGVALVVVMYASLASGTLLAMSRRPRWRHRSGALVGALVVIVALGHAVQVRRDQRMWEQAAVLQRHVVDTVAHKLDHLRPGALVIAYDLQFYTGPQIPVFAYPWDLSTALAVRYGDASVRGYPALGRPRLACGRSGLTIVRVGEPFAPESAPYGNAHFVAVAGRRARPLDDARACRAASAILAGRSG